MQDPFEGIGRRIVLATHRRSGTHLSIDLLRRQFEACAARKRLGEPLDALYLNLERLMLASRGLSEEQALALLRRAPRPIVKTHALPGFEAWGATHARFVEDLLGHADVFSVVRDGRDVLCSLHRYLQAFDARARCTLSDFLRQRDGEVSRVRAWARHVLAWRATPGVRPLAYEEIRSDPCGVLKRLGDALGMQPRYVAPLLPRPLRTHLEAHLLRLFTRTPGATNILGARGAGAALRWREAFTRADREFFHAEAGEALVELGYERDDTWVRHGAAPQERPA